MSEWTRADGRPIGERDALLGLEDLSARLLATQQELVDLRAKRDEEWRVLEAILEFESGLGAVAAAPAFWAHVAETVVRTFQSEAAVVFETGSAGLRLLAHRGPHPGSAAERDALQAALGREGATGEPVMVRGAPDQDLPVLRFGGHAVLELLAVRVPGGVGGRLRWLAIARTVRKRHFFDPLEARQLMGLQLLSSHVGALFSLLDVRVRLAGQRDALDAANRKLALRIEADRVAAEKERALRAELADARRMEAIGRLAGGVAHDFNNLLMVINGNAEMMLEEPCSEDVALLAGGVAEAGARAAGLTQQLLAYSRRQVIRPTEADANALVEGSLWVLKRLVGEDIEVRFEPCPEATPVLADPAQFDRMLSNLVTNARDAIHAVDPPRRPGRILLRTWVVNDDPRLEAEPGSVVLEVTDNGCGMDEATLQRVFEPFFTTKAMGDGTGLGLSTTAGVVHQNGGAVHVKSELGSGTTFEIHWPLRRVGVRGVASRSDRRQGGLDVSVLLVEDDDNVRRFVSRGLRRRGCTVHDFDAGTAALAWLDAAPSPPDLLVTDVVMPDMNGKEVAEAVERRSPGLPVLFVSGYTADIVARHGVLEHGRTLLEKPFGIKDLVERIEGLLGAASAS